MAIGALIFLLIRSADNNKKKFYQPRSGSNPGGSVYFIFSFDEHANPFRLNL